MVTEQIDQEMRATRASIDRKLDLIEARARTTGRRALPAAFVAIAVVAFAWRARRRRRMLMRRLLIAA